MEFDWDPKKAAANARTVLSTGPAKNLPAGSTDNKEAKYD
jgi:hypothetical protein